ncbi:MAG: NAD-dependent epimerase/dehydratase family protein [Thermodesulfobacteriota bacterium]
MKCLVTGGTGFTGSQLVRRLLERGHEVLVVDNAKGLFWDELAGLGAQLNLGSVTDNDLMERMVKGNEVVFHVAAAFRGVDLPHKVYWEVNVEGTRKLLQASLKEGVRRFIYCSTEGVHGHIKNPPADETAPIAPKDYYQYSKWEGEKVVHEYMKKGLPAVILRPTAIYGPGDPERFLMIYRRVKSGFFPMFGSGKITYHPLYIDNLSDAFEASIEREEALGQTYLIADEEYISIEDLVRAVAKIMGQEVKIPHFPFWPLYGASFLCEMVCKPLGLTPPIFRRRADWYRQNRAFSIEKARKELGYHPRVGLTEGLTRTFQWYKEHGYL